MTLKTVREHFVEISGRRDLANEDGTDNGANYYINAGQRLLEGRIETPLRRHAVALPAGAWHVAIEDLREAHEVWIATAEGRKQLSKKDFRELWALMKPQATNTELNPPIKTLSNDTGCPCAWAALPILLSPAQDPQDIPLADYFGHRLDLDGALPGDGDRYRGLMIYPATEQPITLHLIGRFQPERLTQDTDQSWWTANYPEILAHAACWVLEADYRNTEGQNDWLRAIDLQLAGIDRSLAMEDQAGPLKMRG